MSFFSSLIRLMGCAPVSDSGVSEGEALVTDSVVSEDEASVSDSGVSEGEVIASDGSTSEYYGKDYAALAIVVGLVGKEIVVPRDGRHTTGLYSLHSSVINVILDFLKESWHNQLIIEGHAEAVYCCAFSPDGARIVSGSWGGILKIWNAESGELWRTLQEHTDTVYFCAFSPDGARIVSGSDDRTLKIWDAESGELQRTLHGHADAVYCCAFSPDGKTLVSGGRDRKIILHW